MNIIKKIAPIILGLFVWNTSTAQLSQEQRLEWFKQAKLGIFIHWGYYGVNGITESWSLYHKRISYDDYLKQGKHFGAEQYNPTQWATFFKKVGAQYVVLTTKHHDGVALWDSKVSRLSTVKHARAGKDLITPYVQAMRKQGLKVGLYYSLCDWSHPDYQPVVFPRPNTRGFYPIAKNQLKKTTPWQRFTDFNFAQLKEISLFQPDLYWFDGDWEHSAEEWRSKDIKDSLLKWNPKTIVNSRLNQYGDYKTPEQGVPITRPEGAWEFCMTMNDNWGYFPSDTNYKPIAQIIRTFVEVISQGGNLLLDIGMKPDGTIPAEQYERLIALGDWINTHKQAVYATQAGLPYGHFFGPSTLSEDQKKIYLYLFDTPRDYIQLKGIQNKIVSVKVLGTGENLSFVRNGGAVWNNIPGILRINVPKELTPYVTVLEVSLDSPLLLYRGHGNAVELNQ